MAVGASVITYSIGSSEGRDDRCLDMFLNSDGDIFVYVREDGDDMPSMTIVVDLLALEHVVKLLRAEKDKQ